MAKYFIQLGDGKYEVDLTGSGSTGQICVNGIDRHVDHRWIRAHEAVSLIMDGATCTVEFSSDERGCRIHIGGRHIDTAITDERTDTINRIVGTGKITRDAAGEIKAPMPGLVVKIQVQEGDRIAKGQGVIVVEAMKMENEIKSPLDGIVKKILVEPGKAVDKGQLLLVVTGDES